MYTKKSARVTFRSNSNRRPNFKRNNIFSHNKGKNKGNVTQQYNKYLKLAKELSSSGDRIQSEYYYQFTDHYYRMMTELGITLEDNDSEEEKSYEDLTEEITKVDNTSSKEKIEKVAHDDKKTNNDTNERDEDLESIESVPFISKSVKKKSTKVKKASA